MKSLKKFMAVPVCCLAVLLSAGCNTKTYSVYTNMPEDNFRICDKSYELGGLIDGYVPTETEYEEVDTANYTARQRKYYNMLAYSDLVVAANFDAEGAEENYTAFYKAVGAVLDAIDKAISSTVTGSDIYNFNNAKPGARLEVNQITYEVLSQAKYVYTLTDGYYNPALYYNIQAYGFGGADDCPTNSSELPKDEIIKQYTELASHFGEVEINAEHTEEEGEKYYLTKPEYTVEVEGEVLSLKLDLGGIGKGYAVDCIDKLFDAYGYKFGYFNFGTSSMLVKSHFINGEYDLELTGPRSLQRDTFINLKIRNEKLSSSGDNEQYYFIDGTRYCHIISAKTGKPVQTGIMSVTVIGGSAAEDDALTTAIMAMEKDEAIKFIEQKLTDKRVVFTFE